MDRPAASAAINGRSDFRIPPMSIRYVNGVAPWKSFVTPRGHSGKVDNNVDACHPARSDVLRSLQPAHVKPPATLELLAVTTPV